MPIVPSDPGPDDGTAGIPQELQPTPGDLLMAAAIMHQRDQAAIVDPQLAIPHPTVERIEELAGLDQPERAPEPVLAEPAEDQPEPVSPLMFGPEMLQRSTEQEQRRIQPTPLGIVPRESR